MDSIMISDYDPLWPRMFAEEREQIAAALADVDGVEGTEHVGSTAVPGLAAKPVIDIMIGVREVADGVRCVSPIVDLGYECMGERGIPGRIYFAKPGAKPRTHHIHLVEHGSRFWEKHITFRDLMRSRPDLASAYGAFKRRLASDYGADRVGYTFAKSPFIEAALAYGAVITEGEAIVIREYDEEWPAYFEREKTAIAEALGDAVASAVAIEHVGSTAVPGLAAKPLIDIAIGVQTLDGAEPITAGLRGLGYTLEEPVEDEYELYFYKGAPHTHHAHAVEHGGPAWRRYIAFRERLRGDRKLAGRYEALKRELAQRHWDDRDVHAYAHAKGSFVEQALATQ